MGFFMVARSLSLRSLALSPPVWSASYRPLLVRWSGGGRPVAAIAFGRAAPTLLRALGVSSASLRWGP